MVFVLFVPISLVGCEALTRQYFHFCQTNLNFQNLSTFAFYLKIQLKMRVEFSERFEGAYENSESFEAKREI